jgi:hypothetical protein
MNVKSLILYLLPIFAIAIALFFVLFPLKTIKIRKEVINSSLEWKGFKYDRREGNIIFSYGNLLNKKTEEFFFQILIFNSSEAASSYFYNYLNDLRNFGKKYEEKNYEGKKGIIIPLENNEASICILSGEKIFFVRGKKEEINDVMNFLTSKV